MSAAKKPAKKEESESEYETYEYETESEEEEKPAAKKADAKPAAAAAAKPAAKKEESEDDDDDDDDESYEYETESESEDDKKKPAAAAAAKPAAAAAAAAKPAAAAAAAAKPAAKKEESDDDDDDESYEYESEYETESEEKKPEAKKDAAKPAAAAAAKPAAAAASAAKPAAATAAASSGAAKPAAAASSQAAPASSAKAAPATTANNSNSSSSNNNAGAQRSVVQSSGPSAEKYPWQPKNFIAEFVGTMAFCFVTYMVRASAIVPGAADSSGGLVSLALVQTLAFAAVSAAFANVSGGHFNPATTLFLILTRQFGVVVGLVYIIVQFAAAILAGALTWGLLPPAITAVLPGTGFSAPIACNLYTKTAGDAGNSCWPEAFGAEIIGTFVFLMIFAMTRVGGYGENTQLSSAFGLGMVVFAFQNVSNAFFNPARALGSAAFAAEFAWDNFWVWIIGPIIGAIMAMLIWGLIFQSKGDKSKGESLLKHN